MYESSIKLEIGQKSLSTEFQQLKAPEIWSKYTIRWLLKWFNGLLQHQLVSSIQPILVNTDGFILI